MSDESTKIIYDAPAVFASHTELNKMLTHAYNIGASDIFIRSDEPVRISLYGRNHFLTERAITAGETNTLLKLIHSEIAQTELGSSRPLDTSYEIKSMTDRSTNIRFRVNAVMGEHGFTITMRSIPDIPPTVQDLNVDTEIMEAMRTLNGLHFVTGATGNGKSTLLAAIIREALENQDGNHNIVTIESPVEYTYDRIIKRAAAKSMITQIEVGRGVTSFSAGVRNTLRMFPSVVLVGESRDFETMHATLSSAKSGPSVFTTLHSNDVKQTVQRVIDMFPIDQKNQLRGELIDLTEIIVSQRLVPTLDGKRHAIREFLRFDDQIREKIRYTEHIAPTMAKLVSEYGKPFIDDLDKLLKDKLIDDQIYKLYGGILK